METQLHDKPMQDLTKVTYHYLLIFGHELLILLKALLHRLRH